MNKFNLTLLGLKNVSLLIDLAHLKVSAKTLNFSPSEYLKKCDKWI